MRIDLASDKENADCKNIVCTPPLSAGGGGVEPPTKCSKRRGLKGLQFLGGGVAGKAMR